MDLAKSLSARFLLMIFFFMAILGGITEAVVMILLDAFKNQNTGIVALIPNPAKAAEIISAYHFFIIPGIFLLFALIMWLAINISSRVCIKQYGMPSEKPQNKKPEDTASHEAKAKKRKIYEKRLFLHLLSVLQREGRLMDFFSEDLSLYEDEQIGVAVRGIHENCKKVIDKYISLQPVIKEEEDENITIAPGFDPNAIKLTGNVAGEPPFNGVVRHRGWKIKKLDLPDLTGTRDPLVIAPAEVEVV